MRRIKVNKNKKVKLKKNGKTKEIKTTKVPMIVYPANGVEVL